MAYFSENDLQDCVRNGFIVEDTTGLCGLVLPPVKPKARPGGLPITFGENLSESESDYESHSPDFTIPEGTTHPPGIVPLSFFAKREEINKLGKVIYFGEKKMKGLQHYPKTQQESTNNHTSLTSKLIDANKFVLKNPFDEYAKFDVGGTMSPTKCKEFSVTMTFVEPTEEEEKNGEPFILTLSIPNSAKISDLIGLCCFAYTRAERNPSCTSPSDYQLYLADDDHSADTDFPRVDPNTKISQYFFQKLALVRKSDLPNFHESQMTVTVYLINGIRYQIEIENQDTTLEYIRDEAMRLKELDIPQSMQDPGLNRIKEYVLELLSQPDNPVKLSSTVANVGCTEFLMLRRNSTRGDFKPQMVKPRVIDRVSSSQALKSMNTPTTPQSAHRIPKLGRNNSDSQFPFPSTEEVETPPEEFVVERLHKIRPKWSATLIIHPDAIEVTPMNIERRKTLVPQSTPKLTFLDFDVIANAHLSNSGPHKRQIRIIWLWVPTEKIHELYSALKDINAKESPFSSQHNSKRPSSALAAVVEEEHRSVARTLRSQTSISNESDLGRSRRSSRASTDKTKKGNDFIGLLDGARWKTLHLEAREEDAWNIGVKLNAVLDSRYSYVKQMFEQSRNGSRSPQDSALRLERITKTPLTTPTNNRDFARPSTPQTPGKTRRKISMNPMPYLNRMLSRPD
uniref:Sin1 middle CRIM domain-containing protein n=1 Tax=Panagrolaimus sp. ES5 TaxID=591445 RepID=A0AC34FGY7_9BILA